jgi:hypothetical protein
MCAVNEVVVIVCHYGKQTNGLSVCLRYARDDKAGYRRHPFSASRRKTEKREMRLSGITFRSLYKLPLTLRVRALPVVHVNYGK